MAGLLSRKKLIILCAAAVLSCHGAYCFESSFPFPFEFGHSSDIYLDVKKPETKQSRQQNQAANDLLKERGIEKSPSAFVKYIKKNEIGAIKLLLDAGFDPNTNINANYPIFYAAKYNRRQIVYLLLEAGANPNRDLTSPVRYAILHKDYDCVKVLLDYGANVNYEDAFLDETLLYTALKKKQYDIARFLLEKGAKIDIKSYNLIKRKKLERKMGILID